MIFYGASGHAKVVIESWKASGGKVTAIFDDNEKITSLLDLPVSGAFQADRIKNENVIISIGFNHVRKKIAQRISVSYGIVIHPKTTISSSTKLNEGTVVMANVVVNAGTTVGKHCILNTSSSIDHDCIIGNFVHIAPGAILCGNISVGEGTLIGAGSTILPGVKIGAWAVIGAGSVVTRNVDDNAVVAGNPAKSISFKQTE